MNPKKSFWNKFLSRKFLITQEVLIVIVGLLIVGKLPPSYFADILKFIVLIYVGGNVLVHPAIHNMINNLTGKKSSKNNNQTFLD